jgi:hypothetical protein
MKRIARTILLSVLLCLSGFAAATEAVVYIAPDGNDKSTGRSESDPMQSLQDAIRRVLALPAEQHSARKVVVLQGSYLAQVAAIDKLPDTLPLIISAARGERPVFDGNGRGGAWLALNVAIGKPTRVTIEGLEVRNYVTAISFNGDRSPIENFNSENVVRNNVFRNIGQVALPSGKPSTAGIRLVNSRGNQIVRNQFLNIRNVASCGLLHAIYIAHHSSNNLVEGNTFDGGCGAAVKTRDGSGSNIVRGNRFTDQSEPVFLDSFCDKDARDDCSKEWSECPSWNNEFRDNTATRLGPKAQRKPTQVIGADAPTSCPSPPPNGKRLVESNTRVGR